MLGVVAGFGVFIGFVLTLIGAAGGILSTPILTSFFAYNIQAATTVTLYGVCIAALIGTVIAYKQKHLDVKVGALMAAAALPVSFLGIYTNQMLTEAVAYIVFGVLAVLACAKVWILDSRIKESEPIETVATIKVLTLGAIGGFLTGLLGIGGGFLYVPFYRMVLKFNMAKAVGTSLFTIFLVAMVNTLIHLTMDSPTSKDIIFIASMAIGAGLGRLVSVKLENKIVEQVFATVMGLVGVVLIYIGMVS